MFNYSNPVGTGVLEKFGALSVYRDIVDGFYRKSSDQDGTRFERLERFPTSVATVAITWSSFPKTAGVNDAQIDSSRFGNQDEYVEWHVERDGVAIRRIVFTTELPEYYQALAEVSADALIAGIRDAVGVGSPTIQDLFGVGFDPQAVSPRARADQFRKHAVVDPDSLNGTVANPWNNGEKGIVCLGHPSNTTGALFGLVLACAIPRTSGGPASNTCEDVAGACVPGRSSDPRICTKAQEAAVSPGALSLADPAGIRLSRLDGVWRIGGKQVDINDPANNQGVWKVTRNGRRGVLEVGGNVTLENRPIISGAQVARMLFVEAAVVATTPAQLHPLLFAATAPEDAGTPTEDRVTTLLSRGKE